ncbi:SH3 domain-containing protein [Paenimyroides ummariense]|uniref:SH3 domain-containing protein n=1 Tax=Paenimyroides ummariense TaxID=913024 RepID=A0A1I5FS59_9FLAO|nr:SH3 domain-containing protein [Paenimyroides ummariense]SFO26456.1 SH3 domain-containing protein [Paenimyroides ummariense]
MKKALLFVVLSTNQFWAQPKHPVKPLPRLYVVTPTVAFNNEKGSKAVGIFLRGASIDSYEFLEDKYVYKVYTPHTETIYITDTYNVKDRLNGKDDYEKSPAIIVENDGYYGSPHLFTTVASLKIRELPNSSSAAVGNLLNGTPVPIYYYPYNTEAWIPVQIDDKKGYIPVKYVGKRPDLSDLKNQYKKASTLEDQKKFAERILELGWNSNPEENEAALRLYAEFASKNNQQDVAQICLLQADVLKNIPKDDFNLPIKLQKQKQFGFTINNEIEPEKGFKKSFLETNLGKIIDQYTNLDDCGLGDYETNVFFNSVECIGHDVNKTYHIRSMEMINTNGFKIKNTYLNNSTTPSEFLKAGMGLISSINPLTNSYYISNDYMTYEFQFKNDRLFKVSAHYYC